MSPSEEKDLFTPFAFSHTKSKTPQLQQTFKLEIQALLCHSD